MPTITKDTKNKIVVDYEGKLSFKERMIRKFKASNTWVKIGINVCRFILMLGVSFIIIYPFITKIAGSFMTKEDVVDSTVSLIPKNFTFDTYKYIYTENHYAQALLNTILLSLLCAFVQTFVACLVGYGLAKFKFKGNKLVMGAVIVTLVIPHSALKISMLQHFSKFDIFRILSWDYMGPIQLLIKAFPGLFPELVSEGKALPELTNTFWPFAILSLCGLAFKNGLYIYLMRQFFKGVPDELEESAYVDGSGVFRTFLQIIIPLSVPMMITIFLFSFSWQWTDEFYTKLFFISSDRIVYTMPDVYKDIPDSLRTHYAGESLYYSVIKNTAGLMIIAPLIVVYLFCQRYLVQGIERSGLVG